MKRHVLCALECTLSLAGALLPAKLRHWCCTSQVNGKLVTSLGTKVDPRRDDLLVDGNKVALRSKEETVWIAINKPKVTD
jgi:hypothetical protein